MADNDKSQRESDHPFVRVSAVDPTILSEECYMVRKSEPCTIVIFGASGDLTTRKLMPALFNLYKNDGLPESFSIVGCGRTPLDNQGFRERLESGFIPEDRSDRERWQTFAKSLSYISIAYDDLPSFSRLASCQDRRREG